MLQDQSFEAEDEAEAVERRVVDGGPPPPAPNLRTLPLETRAGDRRRRVEEDAEAGPKLRT